MAAPPRSDSSKPFLDVFLSHASEDRADVALPLANALTAIGYTVWISNHDIVPGNSLPLKINEGLRSCRYGVAVISPQYIGKHWTMKELAALTSREEIEKRDVIIPVLRNIDRAQLTAALPLWAPAVSENWSGSASVTAVAIAGALGRPVVSHPQTLDIISHALGLANGEMNLRPRHDALIANAAQMSSAIGAVWKTVKDSNTGMPHSASAERKRARALMLVGKLSGPVNRLDTQTAALESAVADYLRTLRRLLEGAAAIPGINRESLIDLNETYSGVVAATFSEFVAIFTSKHVQTVTFPKRHPDLTRVLNQVGDDLARLSLAFETLVDFCLSELPLRIRLILEAR